MEGRRALRWLQHLQCYLLKGISQCFNPDEREDLQAASFEEECALPMHSMSTSKPPPPSSSPHFVTDVPSVLTTYPSKHTNGYARHSIRISSPHRELRCRCSLGSTTVSRRSICHFRHQDLRDLELRFQLPQDKSEAPSISALLPRAAQVSP